MQIKQSLPTQITIEASAAPASVVFEGVDPNKPVSANLPDFQQVGSTDRYVGNLIANELGPHVLSVYDAGSNLLDRMEIDVVRATDREVALGCQNSNVGPYTHWPGDATIYASTDGAVGPSFPHRILFSTGRTNFQTAGMCGLVEVSCNTSAEWTSPDLNFLKFFTGYWVDESTGKWRVRSMSEDVKGKDDVDGVTPNSAWHTIKLELMLRHEPGDFLGVYMGRIANQPAPIMRHGVQSAFTDVVTLYEDNTAGAAPTYDADNTAAEWTLVGDRIVGIRPKIERPAIALAGHSFWAGAPDSSSIWAEKNDFERYDGAKDPGAYLSTLLDIPCCTVAGGGENIDDWIGSSGKLNSTDGAVYQIAPAVIVYDTSYSDTEGGTVDVDTYPGKIEHLLAHCDSIGAQLAILESPPSKYARDTSGNYVEILKLMGVTRRTCDMLGVPLIQIRNRLGMAKAGDEAWTREYQKDGFDGLESYEPDSDTIHLSQAGRNAAMRAVADAIQRGLPATPSLTAYTNTTSSVSPPESLSSGARVSSYWFD